jgi:RES domain
MGKTVTRQFPSVPLDKLVSGIKSFHNKTPAEKRLFIQLLVAAHPVLNLKWGPGHHFCRARRLSENEAPPVDVEGVIWRSEPQPRQGRANASGFPVIYLADRMETAFCEVRAEVDRAVMAEFTIRENHAIHIAPIGEISQIQRSGRGWLLGDESIAVSRMLNACSPDEAKSLLIADAFLFDCLTNPEDDYDLSSMVAMCIFDKMSVVTAIAYPSRRQRGAINLAVRTRGFWDNWGIVSIRCGLATHFASGYYRFSDRCHVTSIMRSGIFNWDTERRDDHSTIVLDPTMDTAESAGNALTAFRCETAVQMRGCW